MVRFKSLFFITLTVLAFGAVQAFSGSDKEKDIVDTAVEAGSFTTLVAAVQAEFRGRRESLIAARTGDRLLRSYRRSLCSPSRWYCRDVAPTGKQRKAYCDSHISRSGGESDFG